MPRILNKIPGAHALMPGVATRAPLKRLSWPYSSRAVAVSADEHLRCRDAFRSLGTRDARREDRGSDSRSDARCGDDPWHWRESLTTDYWNPPTSESQHARQRILAVVVAFILAAILAQAGW
jgi:hypothetical protein